MQVGRPDVNNLINKFYKQEATEKKSAPGNPPVARKDSVEFSATMETLKKEMARLDEKDDVRAAKIEGLRRQIEAGEYKVDSREMADLLVKLVIEKRLKL